MHECKALPYIYGKKLTYSIPHVKVKTDQFQPSDDSSKALTTILAILVDECIEWQVNYGYQKFHTFLIKIQKTHLELPFTVSSIADQKTIFIQILPPPSNSQPACQIWEIWPILYRGGNVLSHIDGALDP